MPTSCFRKELQKRKLTARLSAHTKRRLSERRVRNFLLSMLFLYYTLLFRFFQGVFEKLFQLEGTRVQLIVFSLFLYQLFVASSLNNSTLIKHHNNVGVFNGG